MTKEIRVLDVSIYNRICEAFSKGDLEHTALVADLCSRALSATDGTTFRWYHSPAYADIGGQSAREVIRSMLEAYLRDGPNGRLQTLDEWGEELASNLMTVLAMPYFQTDYLIARGALRADDPQISPADAADLRRIASASLCGHTAEADITIEWGDPVTLIVLGDMDGGLLNVLESDERTGLLLRLDREHVAGIGLAGGKARALAGDELGALRSRVSSVATHVSGFAAVVNGRLKALLDFATAGPGGVLISERVTW